MEDAIYYIHVNGQQRGPFPLNRLIAEGVTPDTMVWRNGMPNWGKASSIPELQPIFIEPQPAPPIEPIQEMPRQHPAYPYQQINSVPRGRTNWMGWAIAGTVIGALACCLGLIFGIIGLVKAAQANQQFHYGDYSAAKETNDSARTWTIVSLVLGGISLLFLVIFIVGDILAVGALLDSLGSIYNN